MKLYRLIGPNIDDWLRIPPVSTKISYRVSVHASHRWGLPGVSCPTCRRVWAGQLAYPAIDLSGFPEESRMGSGWNTSLIEYKRIASLLAAFLHSQQRPSLLLSPGTKFGPLVGSFKGRGLGDFTFIFNDTILVRPETMETLSRSGIHGVVGVPAALAWKGKGEPPPTLLELQVEPLARLASNCLTFLEPGCDWCGYPGKAEAPGGMAIDSSSVPGDIDLFRAVEWSNQIIATEKFCRAVGRHGLTNVKFMEVLVR